MSKIWWRLASALMLIVLAAPIAAKAQDLNDRFWLNVAAFRPAVDSTAQVAASDNPDLATKIDLESDLDLKKHKILPEFLAGARIGKRFSIVGEYYALNRSNTKTLERDIVFDDVTYPATVNINSKFDSDIYRLSLRYALIKTDNLEVDAALGGHITHFTIQLSGDARVDDVTVEGKVSRRKVLAPLPTIGLSGTVRVAPKLTAGANIDWLSLDIGKYNGRILNSQVGLTYKAFENVGIGIKYQYVNYRLGVKKQEWSGRLRYKFYGPALFIVLSF